VAEAPRGTLSHWVVIRNGKISNYQAVVPTTWNASPRDNEGNPGPYEASLPGTPVADAEKPLEILRTVHSFDPCMACACHTFDSYDQQIAQVKVLKGVTKKVIIAGIGNVLLGDDGLGPYVIEHLGASYDIGPEVELVDAGTPALDFALYFANADMLLVIDAVRSGAPAGTLLRYSRNDILRGHAPLRIDAHSPALVHALMVGDFASASPSEVLLIGAAVGNTEPGTQLTDDVRAAVPALMEMIAEAIRAQGISMTPALVPRVAHTWWESERPGANGSAC